MNARVIHQKQTPPGVSMGVLTLRELKPLDELLPICVQDIKREIVLASTQTDRQREGRKLEGNGPVESAGDRALKINAGLMVGV